MKILPKIKNFVRKWRSWQKLRITEFFKEFNKHYYKNLGLFKIRNLSKEKLAKIENLAKMFYFAESVQLWSWQILSKVENIKIWKFFVALSIKTIV